jgi:hypothetical protein
MPDRIDTFISRAFPNLRNFTIDNCVFQASSFYLNNLNLSRIELRDPFPTSNEHVLVEMLGSNTKRYYTANKISKWNTSPSGHPTDSPGMKSVLFDKFNGLPYKTFICNFLYSFFMVNTSN